MHVSQGLFSPDSLAGAVPQQALAVGITVSLSTSLGDFQSLKAFSLQVSRLHGLAGKVSVACVMQREGLRDGEQPAGLALTLCLFSARGQISLSLSIAWVSPSPGINHNPPHGGQGQAGSSVLWL